MQAENDFFSNQRSSNLPNTKFYSVSPEVIINKVYSAKDSDSKECFAMKTVNFSNQILWNTLQHEYEILLSLQHKNIIKLFNSCFKKELSYILLEWMEFDLQRIIDQKKAENKEFSTKEIENLLVSLLSGLLYLRTQRIFHGDLKPSNILSNDYKSYKIADFGSAFDFKEKDSNICGNFFVGTPNYWPPEFRTAFLRNDSKAEYDVFKVDCFMMAFSVLIAIMLKKPAEIYSLLQEKNDIFKEVESKYGKEIKSILKKMLKLDFKRRPCVLQLLLDYNKENKKIIKPLIFHELHVKRKNIEKFKNVKKISDNVFFVEEIKKTQSFLLFVHENIDEEMFFQKLKIFSQYKNYENIVISPCFYDIVILRQGKIKGFLYYKIDDKDKLYDNFVSRVREKRYFSLDELIDIGCFIGNTIDSLSKNKQNFIVNIYDFFIDKKEKNHYYIILENSFKENIVFSLGLLLLSLSTLQMVQRNEEMEQKLKELYFFNENNIDLILKNYGEKLMQLLLDMIKFNEKKRISLGKMLKTLASMKE